MENISFNLNEIYGTQQPEFSENTSELIKAFFNYESANTYENGATYKTNLASEMDEGKKAMFDFPLFMPLLFLETEYDIMVNGEVKSNGAKSPKFILPLALIEADRTKVIEITSIEGRNGSIKEFSNLGDYQISVKGILVGDDGNYPSQQVQKLAQLENCPVAIDIANEFLQYLNVNKLIVRKINWRNMQGYENLQAFELDCISDENIELVIEKGT